MALAERGISADETLQIINNLSEQGGIEAAGRILAMSHRPDGIFAANDASAVSCLLELKQRGISIPNEIAVVGFNNDPLSRVVEPNLTTINYPGHEMGEIAASTLINAIEQLPSATLNTLVLRHQLIIRGSSRRNK
jgi:LacI family transcriptional regulator